MATREELINDDLSITLFEKYVTKNIDTGNNFEFVLIIHPFKKS
jgi:hypothetical protein